MQYSKIFEESELFNNKKDPFEKIYDSKNNIKFCERVCHQDILYFEYENKQKEYLLICEDLKRKKLESVEKQSVILSQIPKFHRCLFQIQKFPQASQDPLYINLNDKFLLMNIESHMYLSYKHSEINILTEIELIEKPNQNSYFTFEKVNCTNTLQIYYKQQLNIRSIKQIQKKWKILDCDNFEGIFKVTLNETPSTFRIHLYKNYENEFKIYNGNIIKIKKEIYNKIMGVQCKKQLIMQQSSDNNNNQNVLNQNYFNIKNYRLVDIDEQEQLQDDQEESQDFDQKKDGIKIMNTLWKLHKKNCFFYEQIKFDNQFMIQSLSSGLFLCYEGNQFLLTDAITQKCYFYASLTFQKYDENNNNQDSSIYSKSMIHINMLDLKIQLIKCSDKSGLIQQFNKYLIDFIKNVQKFGDEEKQPIKQDLKEIKEKLEFYKFLCRKLESEMKNHEIQENSYLLQKSCEIMSIFFLKLQTQETHKTSLIMLQFYTQIKQFLSDLLIFILHIILEKCKIYNNRQFYLIIWKSFKINYQICYLIITTIIKEDRIDNYGILLQCLQFIQLLMYGNSSEIPNFTYQLKTILQIMESNQPNEQCISQLISKIKFSFSIARDRLHFFYTNSQQNNLYINLLINDLTTDQLKYISQCIKLFSISRMLKPYVFVTFFLSNKNDFIEVLKNHKLIQIKSSMLYLVYYELYGLDFMNENHFFDNIVFHTDEFNQYSFVYKIFNHSQQISNVDLRSEIMKDLVVNWFQIDLGNQEDSKSVYQFLIIFVKCLNNYLISGCYKLMDLRNIEVVVVDIFDYLNQKGYKYNLFCNRLKYSFYDLFQFLKLVENLQRLYENMFVSLHQIREKLRFCHFEFNTIISQTDFKTHYISIVSTFVNPNLKVLQNLLCSDHDLQILLKDNMIAIEYELAQKIIEMNLDKIKSLGYEILNHCQNFSNCVQFEMELKEMKEQVRLANTILQESKKILGWDYKLQKYIKQYGILDILAQVLSNSIRINMKSEKFEEIINFLQNCLNKNVQNQQILKPYKLENLLSRYSLIKLIIKIYEKCHETQIIQIFKKIPYDYHLNIILFSKIRNSNIHNSCNHQLSFTLIEYLISKEMFYENISKQFENFTPDQTLAFTSTIYLIAECCCLDPILKDFVKAVFPIEYILKILKSEYAQFVIKKTFLRFFEMVYFDCEISLLMKILEIVIDEYIVNWQKSCQDILYQCFLNQIVMECFNYGLLVFVKSIIQRFPEKIEIDQIINLYKIIFLMIKKYQSSQLKYFLVDINVLIQKKYPMIRRSSQIFNKSSNNKLLSIDNIDNGTPEQKQFNEDIFEEEQQEYEIKEENETSKIVIIQKKISKNTSFYQQKIEKKIEQNVLIQEKNGQILGNYITEYNYCCNSSTNRQNSQKHSFYTDDENIEMIQLIDYDPIIQKLNLNIIPEIRLCYYLILINDCIFQNLEVCDSIWKLCLKQCRGIPNFKHLFLERIKLIKLFIDLDKSYRTKERYAQFFSFLKCHIYLLDESSKNVTKSILVLITEIISIYINQVHTYQFQINLKFFKDRIFHFYKNDKIFVYELHSILLKSIVYYNNESFMMSSFNQTYSNEVMNFAAEILQYSTEIKLCENISEKIIRFIDIALNFILFCKIGLKNEYLFPNQILISLNAMEYQLLQISKQSSQNILIQNLLLKIKDVSYLLQQCFSLEFSLSKLIISELLTKSSQNIKRIQLNVKSHLLFAHFRQPSHEISQIIKKLIIEKMTENFNTNQQFDIIFNLCNSKISLMQEPQKKKLFLIEFFLSNCSKIIFCSAIVLLIQNLILMITNFNESSNYIFVLFLLILNILLLTFVISIEIYQQYLKHPILKQIEYLNTSIQSNKYIMLFYYLILITMNCLCIFYFLLIPILFILQLIWILDYKNIIYFINNKKKRLFIYGFIYLLWIIFFFGYYMIEHLKTHTDNLNFIEQLLQFINQSNEKFSIESGLFQSSIYTSLYEILFCIYLPTLLMAILILDFLDTHEKSQNTENCCLICRKSIDKCQYYVKQHNIFNYVEYFIYLMKKQQNLSQMEQYIKSALINKDISIFPM